MNKKLSIAIVGGGTAGLVSAIILKTKFPNFEIDLIRSEKIGIIGVGEGSTEHWTTFMDFVGLHYFDIVKECDATFKSGIMFQNWGEKDYLQSIAGRFSQISNHYPFVYGKLVGDGTDPQYMMSQHAWESKVNLWFISNQSSSPVLQFHFNTHKLNDFLTRFAKSKGINFYDDEIVDLNLDSNKNISSIVGNKKEYKYDFYIDSTGFKRILINKLGGIWEPYSDVLKMKSAITFSTETAEKIPMWTAARAMDYGWMFSIPTYGRTGNGYIFDSDYITKDQAHAELELFFGKEIEINKEINFTPGALKETWINNCCAVGLSASFVEPLEASSIGTTIQQTFLLCDLLIDYNENSIKKYNNLVRGILNNIRDFILIHYLTKKENTQFWKDARNVNLPEELKEKLDLWKTKLPTTEDFINTSQYRLFSEAHYILILHGLGLFDIDKIKNEYESLMDINTKMRAEELIFEENNLECQTVPHRTMLEIIRNMIHENRK